MIGAGHRGEKDRPELAIVEERTVELCTLVVPTVVNGLQSRGSFQQQVGFQFTRIGDLLGDRSVRLRRALHCQEAPARMRPISWRPLRPYTFPLLRYGC